MNPLKLILFLFFVLLNYTNIFAQNPLILDQFTADPSARVFGDTIYVFPSHDVANQGKGRENWFCMEDYHVFASTNLTSWEDLGVILHQENVNWVDTSKYAMWAPDCIERNGKYYFYFPAISKDKSIDRSIGVAISNKPSGPYIPEKEPIKNISGIDPNVFIDKDGQPYLYWSKSDQKHGNIFVSKLKKNMLELATEPKTIDSLPKKGLIEGAWMFERNGIYYMTYPHVENKIERLEYAMGKSPLGPFTVTGVIMDESSTGCWTNHHSILKFKKQWYLFYHNNDLSPKFDKNRSIRMDSLFFNDDGTIQKVIPTLRGVGSSLASQKIQIDRYSAVSEKGASIAFLDSLNTLKGWKTVLNKKNAWIRYNSVAFKEEDYKTIQIRSYSKFGGVIEIRLDNSMGKLLAKIKIPKNSHWNVVENKLQNIPNGTQNLFIQLKGDNIVEIDWVKFAQTD